MPGWKPAALTTVIRCRWLREGMFARWEITPGIARAPVRRFRGVPLMGRRWWLRPDMGDTLLSNVGGKIADQFIVQLYVPAYVFWAGGAALYLHAHWTSLKPVVTTLPESNLIVLAAAWLLQIGRAH